MNPLTLAELRRDIDALDSQLNGSKNDGSAH